MESVFLKNKFKKNEGDSLTSTVENRHKIMNTQISVDYNKDASILQMLDQTDGETSGILEEECIKKKLILIQKIGKLKLFKEEIKRFCQDNL